MNREDQDLVALFRGLDTPGVSDAMDKLGLPGRCLGIAPLDNYPGVIIGPAFTVRYVSASTPAGTVGDFIEDVAEGDVMVIDNNGRTDCTVWGDIMTQYAGARKIAGTVIDGVCRDVKQLRRWLLGRSAHGRRRSSGCGGTRYRRRRVGRSGHDGPAFPGVRPWHLGSRHHKSECSLGRTAYDVHR
jgi:regulator of RNase E activity RraA